ncbi:unnamed protein product [Meganyctiphanes norvegica]|uniref:Uncharacterized protein n=1 Tax=Meganyctiphanes norvegica TaxID=48144 RepID=A0AAV2RS38_MEGNR
MTGHCFILVMILMIAALQIVTSDNSDRYLASLKSQTIEVLRSNGLKQSLLSELEDTRPWNIRTWSKYTKNTEFDRTLAAIQRASSQRMYIKKNPGTILSLKNCFVDNAGTGWYRNGDIQLGQTSTNVAWILFTVANQQISAECDYYWLGSGTVKATVKSIEIEISAQITLSSGESPKLTGVAVKNFSGVEADFDYWFLNWSSGLITSRVNNYVNKLTSSVPKQVNKGLSKIRLTNL